MTKQREKPDFVIDPSGAAEDVRRVKHASSWKPPTGPPGNGGDSQPTSRTPQGHNRAWYVIPIPIGLIIFLLVSLVRCLSSPEESPLTFDSESAYKQYRLGNRHLFSGDYDQAILHFNLALHSESDVGDVYNGLGLAYEAKGDHNRALAGFDRALELMADSAMVHNNRAITYLSMGDYERAVTDLNRAVELQPNLGKAYYNRGLVYLALQDYDRAIADLDLAIQHSSHWSPLPTSQPADSGFGLLSGFAEKLEAERYAAPLPSVHYNRGLAYLAKGERDTAIADLQEALRLQPDLTEARNALTLVNAAMAQLPDAQVTPWDWPEAIATATPIGELPASIAVYVPQLRETPPTPVWEITQESCDAQRFEMWVSPGRYLYLVTPDGGASHLVAVVQELRETTPRVGQCRLPWLNYGGASSTGRSGIAADANEDYRDFCAYDSSAPPGAVTTTGREIETKRVVLGTFLTVREDTSHKYHLPYPKYVNDPQGTIATSEWYACGYGLIRSWTSHKGKYQGRDFDKEYGLELVSFTPLSTNESHVRYILVDAQLSNSVAAYRAEIIDEETAEALRRWDARVRVANIEEFERTVINERWRIVFSGTRHPILGTDVILTTDASQ